MMNGSGMMGGLGFGFGWIFMILCWVSSMREAGLPEYAIECWYGFFVPAGTSPAIVGKLFEASQLAL